MSYKISDKNNLIKKSNKILDTFATIPTRYGIFKSYVFKSIIGNYHEHIALIMGDIGNGYPVLTRLHSECLTGDIFGSYRCDCGEQLKLAMQYISLEGRGILLYLRGHEGRGIGLSNKIRAYALQELGIDTVDANIKLGFPNDIREYKTAANILKHFKVSKIRLMSNNPDKFNNLTKYGISIYDRVILNVNIRKENIYYINTKRSKCGHFFYKNY